MAGKLALGTPLARRRCAATALLLGFCGGVALCGCKTRRGLPPRGDGEAVVLLEPDAGDDNGALATVASLAEVEPNNTMAQAQRVFLAPWPLIPGASFSGAPGAAEATARRSVSGTTSAGDADSYRLVLVPPDGLAVDAGVEVPADANAPATPPTLATLAIELVPASTALPDAMVIEGRLAVGSRVFQISTLGPPVRIPNAGLLAGADVLLTISTAKRKNAKGPNPVDAISYRLSITAAAPLAGEEVEPNSEPAQASALQSPTATVEAVGYFGWKQDTDWFALSFPAMAPNTVLAIDLQMPTDGLGTLTVAGDSAGTALHGYTRPAAGRLELKGIAVPAGGPLLVKVQNTGPAINSRYRLTASAVPLPEGFESEPNDLPANAFVATQGRISGFIHPAGDTDVLKVCGRAGMTFLVESPPRLDLDLTVFDEVGTAASKSSNLGGQTTTMPPLSAGDCSLIQIREKTGKLANLLIPYVIKFDR